MTKKLKAGDWVEVRPAREILESLDESGCVEKMPFMEEMLQYVGKSFQVASRAHKTCDTVNKTGGRRLANSVHLRDTTCDGSGHGDCDANCLLFWKTDWLVPIDKPVTESKKAPSETDDDPDMQDLLALLRARAVTRHEPESQRQYICQATQLYEFSNPLKWWDLRQYFEDVSSGNVSIRRFSTVLFFHGLHKLMGIGIGYRFWRKIYDRLQPYAGGFKYPFAAGSIPKGKATPSESLELEPGETIQIKPFAEILETLDKQKMNKGMRFDPEMVPYCEKEFKVHAQVRQIVDERSGKMIRMKTPSVILKDVVCRSEFSNCRLFCPRALPSYWREIWLKRTARN